MTDDRRQDSASQPAGGTPHHRLHVAARTDPGLIRANNEDSFFAGSRMLVVADGMGGHAAGEVASRLVVDAFAPLDTPEPSPDLSVDLVEATRRGNAAIAATVAEHPAFEGMGTTVTAILFDGRRAALAHVGDSRAYLYRSGVLHQLTHDDTFVQSLVDEGRITEAQAHDHPQRNLVLRALTGIELDPSIAIREARRGDRYLVCSDGLCGVVGAEAIADALADPDPDAAADALIQLALDAGAPDNVTVIVADVVEIDDAATTVTMPVVTEAFSDDPSSTNPIQQLTREMPRVPLPPIPEEPGGAAEIIGGAGDDEDDFDDEDEDTGEDGEESVSPDEAAGHGDGGDVVVGDRATGENDADPGTVDAAGPTSGVRTVVPWRRLRDRRRGNASGGPVGPARPPAQRRRFRRGAIIVTAAVVLVAAITGSTIWVRHQYFVSDQGNLVVVFRGVDGSLLGWHFSTFQETSCAGNENCAPMKVSDLQPAAQNQVRAGIKATSLADARDVVQRLSGQLLPPCPQPDADSDTNSDTDTDTGTGGTTADEAPADTPDSVAPGATPPEAPSTEATTPRSGAQSAPTTPPAAALTSPPPRAAEPPELAAAAPGILARTLAAVKATGAAADGQAHDRAVGLAQQAPAGPEDYVTADRAASDAPRVEAAGAGGAAHPLANSGASTTTIEPPTTESTAAPTSEPVPSAVTVTETVTATPLAPAPAVPGVTCRNVP